MAKVAHALIVTILMCGTLGACKGGREPGSEARRGGRSLVVRTAQVTASDVVYKVQALGSLEPEELVRITAEVTGAVKEVMFHAGDRVAPETVLARIDPDRYRLEAERSEASHRKAVADFKRAEADLQRREALALENLVAPEELNRARLEAERLAADAASANAASEIAQQNARRSAVHPQRAGEIDTRSVDTGQFVQVGDVLATLVDLRRLRLRFKVSDSASLKAAPGQAVRFRVASLGNAEFAARVYHVGDVADVNTRQVEVLAWVDNPGPLKPGFFAEVTLATETHKGAIVIPESAIQASERGFVVYVVQDDKALERPVTIGLRTGDGSIEILSGLAAGETIVVEGSDRLSDGIGVQDAQKRAPEPAGGAS